VKTKNNALEHELEIFSRNLENLKRESNEFFQTIKLLENENNLLNKEKVTTFDKTERFEVRSNKT